MADEQKYTQADLDAAIEKAVGPIKSKLDEVMDEAKDAKRKLRAASEIKPEDLTAAEERADKLAADLAAANKNLATITKERDAAAKALETEQATARNFARDAELNGAIASGNVIPALVPAFKALLSSQAQVDLADGKYSVKIGDKVAGDYIKEFLGTDEGKAYVAAPMNGGGGAPGSGGASGSGKTVTRAQFDAMSHPERASFAKDGGKVVDQAA